MTMESDNSQKSEHRHESVLDTTTNSHQDISSETFETQLKPLPGKEKEIESSRRKSLELYEADPTVASGESSGGKRGEEQPERVNSPETAEHVQKNASTSDASPLFKPLQNSVLHSALESPAKKQVKEPLFRPSPPSEDEDIISVPNDVISLHSTNSEAASDTESAIVVEEMMSSYGSLFTPPASSDDDTPLVYTRSFPSKSRKPPRYVMSHVEVPPLRRPKSDYKDSREIFPSKPPKKKKAHVQAHSSLLAALQSQLAHNSEIHDDEDMIVDKRPKKKSAERNAVAGPSRLPRPSDKPRSKGRPKRRLIESSGDESAGEGSRKRQAAKGKSVESQRKRQKVTIDLTVDDDDTATPAPSTPRRSPSRRSTTPQPEQQTVPSVSVQLSPISGRSANHSSPIGSPTHSAFFRQPSINSFRSGTPEPEGHQRLNLRFYQYPPPSILHVNTHFHRQWFHDTLPAQSVISSSVESSTTQGGGNRTTSGVLSSRFPWVRLLGGRLSHKYLNLEHDADADVISLGYASLGLEDDDSDVDFEDANADVPPLKLERRPSTLLAAEEEVRPVKIDLAAELKKKKLAKGKQKQKQNTLSSGSDRIYERADVVPATSGGRSLLALPSGSTSAPFSSDSLGLPYLASNNLRPPPPPSSTQQQQNDNLQVYLTSTLPSSSTALALGFPALPSPAGTLPYAIRRPLGDLGVFMHDYAARPSSPDSHTQIPSDSLTNVANASSLASFSTAVGMDAGANPYPDLYSLALQQGTLAAATSTTDVPHFHQSDEILPAATRNGAGRRLEADAMFLSGTVFDGGLPSLNESWMTTGQQFTADYGYDTVDPTLICGGLADYDDGYTQAAGASEQGISKNGRARNRTRTSENLIDAADEECPGSDDDREEANVASLLSDTSKAGSLFSGRSGTSETSPLSRATDSSSTPSSLRSSMAPLPTSLTSMDGSPSSQSSGFSSSKAIRLETPESFGTSSPPIPSASNNLVEPLSAVSEGPSHALAARSEFSPLSELTSLSDDSFIAPPGVTESNPATFPKANKLEVVIVQKQRKPAPGWEEDTPDDDVYCHQCRSRSSRPKTRCACKAKYCSRCINVQPRYVQMLKIGGRVYSCPRCEQWCTCSACCKKRGETYVPMKARTVFNSPSPAFTLHVDTAHSPRPPPASRPPPSPVQTRKVFLSPSSPPCPSPLPHTSKFPPSPAIIPLPSSSIDTVPSSQSALEPLARTPTKKSRVFLGKAQPSWGLGKKPRTRELNPAPRAVWPQNPTGSCTVRYYIGRADFLKHRQMRLESTDDLLAGLTSVASLEDSDLEDADDAASATSDDEEISTVKDDRSDDVSLCQRDVAKAISATYESLGHSVILSEELCQ